MFTPGFKYFFGLALVGLIGALVYGISSGDVTGPDYFGVVDRQAVIGLISLGWKGNVGAGLGFFVLIFFAGSAAYIGSTVVAFRDADVESVAELDNSSTMPPAQRPTAPSWWPAAAAVGVGVLLIGLVLDTRAFWIIGVIILAVVAIEWSLTSWSERSTASTATNAVIRDRVMAPFEIPLLATALGAILALSISRILLWQQGSGAVIIASVLAAVIFGIAILMAAKPDLSRNVIGGIVGLLAIAIIALGVLGTALREDHHGEDHGSEGDHSAMESTVSAG
ncbi:MAG: hypothetical protein AAF567_18400 [Actinomycetota bacterium]